MQAAATAPSASRSTRTRRPRPVRLAYPEMLETPAASNGKVSLAMFWRVCWLRDVAEQVALEAHLAKVYERASRPLQMALSSADGRARSEVKRSFDELVRAGGLLYAWVPDGAVA